MLKPSCLAWRSVDKARDRISEGFWYVPTASDNAGNRQVAWSFFFLYFSGDMIIANVFHGSMTLNCSM